MAIGIEVVRLCEKMISLEVYQNWLWRMSSIARRRGGTVVADGDVQAGLHYLKCARELASWFAQGGAALVCCAGQKRVERFVRAVDEARFLEDLAAKSRRGLELFLSEEDAGRVLELRRSTQPMVDWVMSEVRMQQELFESEKGVKGEKEKEKKEVKGDGTSAT